MKKYGKTTCLSLAKSVRVKLWAGMLLLLLTGGRGVPSVPAGILKVLVFDKVAQGYGSCPATAGKTKTYWHASIVSCNRALQELAATGKWDVKIASRSSIFHPDSLAEFDVIVLNNNMGDILNEAQQQAFEDFMQHGKGVVALHAANASTELCWPWYRQMLGDVVFAGHPEGTPPAAVYRLAAPGPHPLPAEWPDTLVLRDEWYAWRNTPAGHTRVLLAVAGTDVPVAWVSEYLGGRVFYTSLGHPEEQYSLPLFRQLLVNAINWAGWQDARLDGLK